MSKRITLKIGKIMKETDSINTYTFYHKLDARPGQFIMLTDFEGGEKPFSISDCTENEFSVTIKKIGEFTTRLFSKREGDFMSFRGAYGSSFFISNKKVLLVGGGYGVPPLYFLAKRLLKAGTEVVVVNGARTEEDLLFDDKFKELNIKYINITEKGDLGKKGTSVSIAKKLLKNQLVPKPQLGNNNHPQAGAWERENREKFDFLYAAGPEKMMKNLQKVIGDIFYEFLLERYMKCAIGICGNCTVDPLGIRLCVEGPVLRKKLVEQLTEFGKYHRDASGKRIGF